MLSISINVHVLASLHHTVFFLFCTCIPLVWNMDWERLSFGQKRRRRFRRKRKTTQKKRGKNRARRAFLTGRSGFRNCPTPSPCMCKFYLLACVSLCFPRMCELHLLNYVNLCSPCICELHPIHLFEFFISSCARLSRVPTP